MLALAARPTKSRTKEQIEAGCLRPWLPIRVSPVGATWRSGYAAVCKTVYTSSILVVASTSLCRGLLFLSDLRFASVGAFVICGATAASAVFLGSSAVEHSTVNRMVAGSNPARGAKILHKIRELRSPLHLADTASSGPRRPAQCIVWALRCRSLSGLRTVARKAFCSTPSASATGPGIR